MMTESAKIGHNSEPLTDAQSEALFHHHKRHYVDALAKKKAADADLRNACKRAKAEGVNPKDIKFALSLEADPEAVLAEQREQERIARWMGIGLGGQADMFAREPIEEKAFREGRAAGAAGKDCATTYDGVLMSKWIEGWHKGQSDLQSSLALFKSVEPAPADEDQDGDEFADEDDEEIPA